MRGSKKEYLKIIQWREKAKQRRQENEKYKKRIKEVIDGRESWKSKYKFQKQRADQLSKSNEKLRRKLGLSGGERVKGHHYTLDQISICLQLRIGAKNSLRSCLRTLQVLSVVLGLEVISPSIATIRNWELKLGYHQLRRDGNSAGKWVLIIDESVMVGQQKMLLILGVNLEGFSFDKALDFTAVEVLGLRVGTSCKAEHISQAIEQVRGRNYPIAYVVSDNGTNIVKALRISQLRHVEDCTHAIGLLIEKRYENGEDFKAFSKRSALFKRQVSMSKHAAMMPPKQRSKARFLNLTSLSKWGIKVLKLARKYQRDEKQKEAFDRIKWVIEYQVIIEDMQVHHELMNQVLGVLKKEGLSVKSQEKCQNILLESTATQEFKDGIKEYLSRNIARLDQEEKGICSSDIIESMFGSFKNRMSKNKNVGFTEGALAIANTSNNLEKTLIKRSMEEVRTVDISLWAEQNLKPSLLKRKKELFKNVG